MKIDADEKELLESVERGEWKSAKGGKRERTRYALPFFDHHRHRSHGLRLAKGSPSTRGRARALCLRFDALTLRAGRAYGLGPP
jgi:hypothetical protein